MWGDESWWDGLRALAARLWYVFRTWLYFKIHPATGQLKWWVLDDVYQAEDTPVERMYGGFGPFDSREEAVAEWEKFTGFKLEYTVKAKPCGEDKRNV